MMALTTASVSPKAAPLPPVPSEDPLTAAQWKTLLAISDTIIPRISPVSVATTASGIAATDTEYSAAVTTLKETIPDEDGEEIAKKYLYEKASDNPEFRDAMHTLFALQLPMEPRKQLGMIFNILE